MVIHSPIGYQYWVPETSSINSSSSRTIIHTHWKNKHKHFWKIKSHCVAQKWVQAWLLQSGLWVWVMMPEFHKLLIIKLSNNMWAVEGKRLWGAGESLRGQVPHKHKDLHSSPITTHKASMVACAYDPNTWEVEIGFWELWPASHFALTGVPRPMRDGRRNKVDRPWKLTLELYFWYTHMCTSKHAGT